MSPRSKPRFCAWKGCKLDRVTNPLVLSALLDGNVPEDLKDGTFDAAAWLADDRNIALRIDDDLGTFDYIAPGIFLAHVWFSSRGQQALDRARLILGEMFDRYGATRLGGETPASHPNVWAFALKLGFRQVGVDQKPMGNVILSVYLGDADREHQSPLSHATREVVPARLQV